MLNKYNRVARIYPAMLCSLPIFVLNYFLLSHFTADFVGSLETVKWVGGLTLSVVFSYLLAQVGRFIGKELFEKIYFNDEMEFPTTEVLLHKNSVYSKDYKDKLHSKIFTDFGIKICSLKEEEKNVNNAKKVIVECVSLIRGRVGNGSLLLQHNIEYGFVRNLTGGSVYALFISIIDMYVFGHMYFNQVAFSISIFLTLSYFLIIVLSKMIIPKYGLRYAKVLLQEYTAL